MADLANFSIVRNGSVTVSVPQFNISCDVIDSKTGALIRSLSGTFPASLANFTNAEKEQAFTDMIFQLILLKAT